MGATEIFATSTLSKRPAAIGTNTQYRRKEEPAQGGRQTYALKRAIDVVVSCSIILCILSWLAPLLFILIKADSRGPFIFRQRRVGKDGKIFFCYKFRTMHPNLLADVRSVMENDDRITRVGSMLRRLHIDELPQVFNVLRGDMGLVGPRPHMLTEDRLFSSLLSGYKERQKVRPGITGLAQAKGFYGPVPDTTSLYFRTKLDRFYVRKVSFLLDARIILATLRISLRK